MTSIYSSSKVQSSGRYSPYSKFIEVYGLKILGLGKIGGQPAVQDEFLKKTAQTFKLLLNPNARGINKKHQIKALKTLASKKVIQRVGVEAYDAYAPRLDNDNYKGWDKVNDSTNSTDFIWHLRDKKGTYSPSGDAQITETIEHALHTLTQFALPETFPDKLNITSKNGKDSGISGDLYAALQEAIDNGVYNINDYEWADDGSEEYGQLLLREYLYCLIYAEWGFTKLYTEDKSLSPEWSDSHLSPKAIARDNPLGHSLFKKKISKVISKPSQAKLEAIFQDGDTGLSGYKSSKSTDSKPDSDNKDSENNNHEIHAGAMQKKMRSSKKSTDFIFDYAEVLTKKNADKIIGFNSSKGDRIVLDSSTYPALPTRGKPSIESVNTKKEFKQLTGENIDLIYFKQKGQLFLNANGAERGLGDKQEGGLLAVLKGGPSLTLAEIEII